MRAYFRPIIYLTVGPCRRTAPCPNFARMCGYIVTPQKKKFDPPHPGGTPGGFRGLPIQCPYLRASVLSSYYILDRRTAPCPNFARMCGYNIVSPQKKNLTHPTPGGFRGLYIVKNLSRRIPPKFGTHVRIDTLTLKKKNLTHPTPGGFRGLYIVKNLSRRTAPKFGTHVQIDTLTLKKLKQFDPPHPRGGLGG